LKLLIANTIKGKGISVIENNPAWHHKAPTKNELETFKIRAKNMRKIFPIVVL
jgi:transketolase